MTATASPFSALSVTILGDAGPWQSACLAQPWQVQTGDATEAALLLLAGAGADVLIWAAAQPDALLGLKSSPALAAVAADTAVLVLVPQIADTLLLQLVRLGVEDVLVLPPAQGDASDTNEAGHVAAQTAALARAVQVAVARKRMTVLQRKGGSIDLATGLPTRLQWLDHLSQLCALREREPAPMAALVLRIEGTSLIEQQLGADALSLVQRKLAVRLRAALRASDVVGTVAPDTYAVLLAWMESDADADLVAGKLLRSLEEPVRVGTEQAAVAVATGIAHYGADGKDGAGLLRIALARAGATSDREPAARAGRVQPVGLVDRGRPLAANDADTED